ncbi:MAG: MFS transporter [Xanthobacteraceae bacterium]|jgi:AAHS family 4-hydroxybenzoate transporter-like MFS transporter
MSERTVIDVSQVVEQQKLGGFLVGLVVISWIITFFDGFDSQAIAFAAPYLSNQYHLDRIMMGNIFSMGLVGALIGGFGFGYLGDRIGRRPAIILATAAFGLLTLAFVFADSYASLLALRLIDGIALGGMLPLSWALNIEYVPKRYRSTVVTVIMIGYSVGIAVGGPAANWLIPQYGWQSLFAVGGALSLVAALALVLILPESARFLASKGWQPRRVADLLRRLTGKAVPADAQFVAADEVGQAKHFNPALLFRDQLRFITPLLWLAYIASSIAVFFLATWTPLVFEALNFTRSQAALAASVNAAAGAVGGLLLMRFTDNIGAIAVTAMPLLAIPLLLIAAFVDVGQGGFFALFALIALFLIGGHFGLHSIAGIFYPSAYRGNGAGWAISVAKIGSIAGPFAAGLILSTNLPVRYIFAVLAICPAVFVVCIFIVGRIHSSMLRGVTQTPPASQMAEAARSSLARL